ncbi:MAG: hypothetical protein GY749_28270 [Desulfobacteraceae bacterium]|nr:hypothetical protein [Desulfobacteraceae bacterium]
MEEKIKKYDDQRTATIIAWLNKIEKSKLTVSDYFKNNNVPFSRSQYCLRI